MAFETQRPDVLEIAFAATFDDGHDMIGVPKAVSGTGAQPPFKESFQPRGAAKTFDLPFCMQAVEPATDADTAIAFQNPLANIGRIATQTPLFHAPIRTKSQAALGNFEIAPTAKIAAIRALRKSTPVDPTATHCSSCTHVVPLLIQPICDTALQKIPKTEHDSAQMHLSLGEALEEGCDPGCDQVYSAIARTL